VAVDQLRAEGIKAGNLRIKGSGPSPSRRSAKIAGKAAKVAVVDRNISYGCHGIFYQEVKSALYGGDARRPFSATSPAWEAGISPGLFQGDRRHTLWPRTAGRGHRLDWSEEMKKEKTMTLTLPRTS
jgi:hypothetical protein